MIDLCRQLSQALVAFTIEFDNEFEHRMPHRTAATRRDGRAPREPWLVSQAMWANVMQYVEPDGIARAELHVRSGTSRDLLTGMQRWGYVSVAGAPGHERIRPTRAGRHAQEIWRPLDAEIERRWRDRLGGPAVAELREALQEVLDRTDSVFPAYLPVTYPTQGGRTEPPVPTTAPRGEQDLSARLAGVLQALTLDFEAESKLSLAISTNPLRVLAPTTVRVRDLPALTGVSREAIAMAGGWLERHGCAEVTSASTGRALQVRLTTKGVKAQLKYQRVLASTERGWEGRYGASAIDRLRRALSAVVDGEPGAPDSPLMAGLTPYPDGWRAAHRGPIRLPHYPMVLHRGGYPDGA